MLRAAALKVAEAVVPPLAAVALMSGCVTEVHPNSARTRTLPCNGPGEFGDYAEGDYATARCFDQLPFTAAVTETGAETAMVPLPAKLEEKESRLEASRPPVRLAPPPQPNPGRPPSVRPRPPGPTKLAH
jgi:hypothetical protein